jgi:GWxTD domain-containing protein
MQRGIGVLLVLFCVTIALGEMARPGRLSREQGPEFLCRVGQFLADTPDSVRLLVVVAVPFDNLQFIRGDSGFQAAFEVVSSVYSDTGALISERISNRTAVTRDYSETNLATRAVTHVDNYRVVPGDYRVRVVLTEKESSGQSLFETEVSAAALDPLLQLSDIFWVEESQSDEGLGALRIAGGFFTDEESALVRFQVASAEPESLGIVWQILGGSEVDSLGGRSFRIAAGPQPEFCELRVDLLELGAGDYILHVAAEDTHHRVVRELPFSLVLRGLPRSVVQLDLAIRQVRYIATNEEMRRLRDAPPRHREAVFRDFWQRRDPTPGTVRNELMEEYYYRVEYSNRNFGTNRAGWETDRGRIYIRYGQPSDIERYPFEINSKPYEVWYYDHLNRRFVFVDYTGFGDYELVGSEWGQ